MKCQILFSVKNDRKNITNLTSTELGRRMVKVNMILRKHAYSNILKILQPKK